MTAVVDAHSAAHVPPDAPASGRNAPVWQRLSLVALLLGTAIAYLANLSANGWANSFYSAAIQAGSESWKAWFFGSSDMANSITVDKPPASLWIPGISVRIFGLNSWSILVPEVLMGVASVALLYLITKKYFGHWPGILAGLVLAVTPVAAMMFRFDNPDAMLVLVLTGAAYALTRAVERGRTGWLVDEHDEAGFADAIRSAMTAGNRAAMAAEAIDSGKARQTLRALAALSNGQDPE